MYTEHKQRLNVNTSYSIYLYDPFLLINIRTFIFLKLMELHALVYFFRSSDFPTCPQDTKEVFTGLLLAYRDLACFADVLHWYHPLK